MSKPIIPITIAYLVGLIFGSIFNYFPITVIAAIIFFIIIEIILHKYNPPVSPFTPFRDKSLTGFSKGGLRNHIPFLFLVFLFGLFYYQLLSAPPSYNDISKYIDREKTIIEGVVYQPPEEYERKDIVYIKTQKVYINDRVRQAAGRLRLSIYNNDIKLRYGDIIRFEAKLKKPRSFWNPGTFDYEAYLARKGVYALASIGEKNQIEIIGNTGNMFFIRLFEMRDRIKKAVTNSLTGPPAAILLAMIIGNTTGLTDEIRDTFMASGTTHILSISGSHLGLIVVFIFLITRFIIGLLPEKLLLRITMYTTPTKIAAAITIVPVIFYALISGAQTATIRSLIMILVYILAVLVDRGNEILNSLALSALIILLIDPLSIHDISFQLTMVSVLFIALAIELKRQWAKKDKPDIVEAKTDFTHSISEKVFLYLFITIAVSLGTAPIVAFYFRQVAWVGLFANSIVVPFAGFLIVPLGLLSSIISVLTGIFFFSGLNEFLLNLFYSLVKLFAQIPYAEIHIASPGIFYLSLFYILVFLLYRQRQMNYKAIFFIGLMLFSLIARPLISQFDRNFKVTFLDVGQGDSAVIEFPDRKIMIIDGGGIFSETFDIGRAALAPFLWDKGIHAINYMVLTHPQLDHVGGFPYLLEKMKIKEVWENSDEGESIAYRRFDGLIKSKGILRKTELSDMKTDIRDVKVSVIGARERASINDRSIVLKISNGDYSLLFAADIENKAQEALLKHDSIKSNIIKVPHHGAKSSLNEDFIRAVSPEIAVVSVGYQNRYRHPSSEHIEGYEKVGARIFRTDKDGAIILKVNERGINIKTYKEAALKRINLSGGLWGIFSKETENIHKLILF
ncbi:MAG: DNA internalization-related competence protein ComEC/Rec2 [Nitrospirae bacterium RBG_19FT_COMBO_42_15]|nr:MAG: DNA internalization-related competence protein ComEC/Rec2 [Nitrospirae bacterium RBG_19FT_COMBO_42_15]